VAATNGWRREGVVGCNSGKERKRGRGPRPQGVRRVREGAARVREEWGAPVHWMRINGPQLTLSTELPTRRKNAKKKIYCFSEVRNLTSFQKIGYHTLPP
jgi:hypothetical protein